MKKGKINLIVVISKINIILAYNKETIRQTSNDGDTPAKMECAELDLSWVQTSTFCKYVYAHRASKQNLYYQRAVLRT